MSNDDMQDRIRQLELERDIETSRRKRNNVTLIGLLLWIFLGVPACTALMHVLAEL